MEAAAASGRGNLAAGRLTQDLDQGHGDGDGKQDGENGAGSADQFAAERTLKDHKRLYNARLDNGGTDGL